jgi:class 3 adenylate cyclase
MLPAEGKESFLNTASTIARRPSLLVWAFLVFAATCAVGLTFTIMWADAEMSYKLEEAKEVAEEVGDWFSSELDKALLPLFTMRQFVIQTPEFAALHSQIGTCRKLQTDDSPADCEASAAPPKAGSASHRNLTGRIPDSTVAKFEQIARSVKRDASQERVLVNVQLAPKAVVSLLYPMVNTEDFDAPLKLDNRGAWGHDLLNDPKRAAIAYATVPAEGVVIAGPLSLVQSNVPVVADALIARLPISFTPSQGHSIILPQKDGSDRNYDVWGFAVILLNWAELKKQSGLYERFKREKMHFRLTRTDFSTDPETKAVTSQEKLIAESVNASDFMDGKRNVSVDLDTTNNKWVLQVAYQDGFEAKWKPWTIAGVVVGSFVLALLVLMILVKQTQHEEILFKMMPANAIKKLRRGQTVIEKYNNVTIFFSDIVGFTTIAGEMTPTEVMSMLNQLYVQFDKLVDKHKVYKVETIGDAYMVLGGAPNRCSDVEAAEKVALFALDAIKTVQTWRPEEGTEILIRAGLASGPVVAGVVGNAMPRYCLFGDTVNFASRMESTSVKMKIQCAELTYHLLMKAPNFTFTCHERREGQERGIEVKGKGRLVTYWIEGASPGARASDAPLRTPRPLPASPPSLPPSLPPPARPFLRESTSAYLYACMSAHACTHV